MTTIMADKGQAVKCQLRSVVAVRFASQVTAAVFRCVPNLSENPIDFNGGCPGQFTRSRPQNELSGAPFGHPEIGHRKEISFSHRFVANHPFNVELRAGTPAVRFKPAVDFERAPNDRTTGIP
jgi:hypothetical protein